jgi:hypothetical protein
MTPADLPAKLRDRIQVTDSGCWMWTRGRGKGYGGVRFEGRDWAVHRLVHTLLVGEIPAGLHGDHLCHNDDPTCPGGECAHRACCNPEHVAFVTPEVNAMSSPSSAQARRAAQTACVQGHAYTPANTVWWTQPNGRRARSCRTCRVARTRQWHARRRVLADAGMAAPQLLARALFLLTLTALASVLSWYMPGGTPVAVLIAGSAWYVIARLLGAGALATGRHQRAGGGQ